MKILVTGSMGQLGQEFYRIKKSIKHFFLFTDLPNLDICSPENINSFLKHKKIDCIINCAAYTNVKKAETEKKKAFEVNANGVKNLVNYCEKNKIKLIHFSTDYVYSSDTFTPILEEDSIDPKNYYGFSKRQGEIFIENSKSESIVIRTSWLYSKFGNNFVNTIIKSCHNKEKIKVVNDQYGCPTYAKNLAEVVMKILESNKRIDDSGKVFNYSNEGSTSWFNFAQKIVELYKAKLKIIPVKSDFFHDDVKRPKFTITSKNKIIKTFKLKIDNWDKSLNHYIMNDLL